MDGITKFYVQGTEGQTFSEVDESEVAEGYFDVILEEVGLADSPIPPQPITVFLILRAAVFDRDKKWQFIYDHRLIFATILDEDFNNKVFNEGARFGVGDRFQVELLITQSLLSDGNIRPKYEITKIIDIVQGPTQLKLN